MSAFSLVLFYSSIQYLGHPLLGSLSPIAGEMQTELLLLTALHWPAVQAGPDRRKLAVPASSSLALVCLCECLIRHTQSNLIDYRRPGEELIVITKTASIRSGFQATITRTDVQPVKQTASFTAVCARSSSTGGNKRPAKDDSTRHSCRSFKEFNWK